MNCRAPIRLNLRLPDGGAAPVDLIGPLVTEASLAFRQSVSGLINGDGITPAALAELLMTLGNLPADIAASSDMLANRLVVDVWVHATRER